MIRDLEEVAESQDGQPGGVTLDNSPIILALEKEGGDAVEPLLACFESENRLTRSVSFGRDFHSGRNLIRVSSAAYVTLGHILQTTQFGIASEEYKSGTGSRAALTAAIRAYWKKNKNKSPAERWYSTLTDDNAHPSQWVEAAKLIVQPIDVEERGGWVVTSNRNPGDHPPMRGELLRIKKNPSVSELLATRVWAIAEEDNGSMFAQNRATDVALNLAAWDSHAAIPVLREQIRRCRQHSVGSQETDLMNHDIKQLDAAIAAASP